MNKQRFIVEEENSSMRLDAYLSTKDLGKSRSYIQKSIEDGNCLVNGKIIKKASYKVNEGEEIEFSLLEDKPLDVVKKDIPINIIYQDDDLLVINKPRGMVVHPANGHYDGDTLVNALLYHIKDLSSINGVVRPGIVHRIDKDTSGLLMIAKNDEASLALTEQLKTHSCKRRYQALVYGTIVENRGKINAPIGRDKDDRKKMAVTKLGKEAITHFTVLKRYKGFT